MEESLQFHQPIWIGIGVLICILLGFGMRRWNRRRAVDLGKLAHSRSLAKLTESVSIRRRKMKQALWLVAVFLLFVSVARPQYGFEWREVKRRGIDLVFAVDTSRSMLAEDVVPNRLERSKLAIVDFVEKLEGDRVGLIPFAGNAFALCPLTLDYGAFRQSLDALDTNIIPHMGTDLATAVREANRLFDAEGNNHRILILITDGEDLQGSVMEAVEAAKEKGMTIHTVGVGNPEGALIPITGPNGGQDFVRDLSGQLVKTALDESTLKKIAEATGGIYAPLGRGGEGLATIYREKLRLVPKSELNQRLDRIPLERFEWPLAAAIVLLLVEFLFGDRRRDRRKKAPLISVARRKVKAAAILLLLSTTAALQAQDTVTPPTPVPEGVPALPNDPREIYNAGTSAYEAGEFEQAEDALGASLKTTTDLELQQRSYYNLGNTRYRLGQQTAEENPEITMAKWEESIKAYDDALALNPADEDAKFNREFVQRKLDALKKQQQQNQQQQNQDQKQDQQQDKKDEQNQEQNSEKQQDSKKDDAKEESGDQKQDQPKDDGEKSDQDDSKSGEQKNEAEKPQNSEEEKEDKSSDGKSGEESKSEEKPGESDGPKSEKAENAENADKKEGQSAEPGEPKNGDEKKEDAEPSQPQSETGDQENQPAAQPNQQAPSNGEPAEGQLNDEQGASMGQPGEERRAPGEMSKEEAVQLLEALKNDERTVMPLPDARAYRQNVPNNTTRGKTW